MKIVHITGNYIEGWGYQENLLPLYQRRAGHDVVVISDNNHLKYSQNKVLAEEIVAKGTEYEHDGIRVYKIKTFFNTSSTSIFCHGLYEILEREQPNLIFHHDVNVSTLPVAANYKRLNPYVKLYADNHADWINESKNIIWHKLFYETLIPWQVRRMGDHVDFYIGVSPMRCKYLHEVFKVPNEKIRFLPIGCDTAGAEHISEGREDLRRQYNIKEDAFVVVSGGKLDKTKGTLALIEACERLKDYSPNLKLILFGKIDEEIMQTVANKSWITTEGWCDRSKTLSLLKIADVACWPWLHTTLIEDAVALGIPLVVKKSDNVKHFAKVNAGFFLKDGNVDEICKALFDVKQNAEIYRNNTLIARDLYSYSSLIKQLENESFCEL